MVEQKVLLISKHEWKDIRFHLKYCTLENRMSKWWKIFAISYLTIVEGVDTWHQRIQYFAYQMKTVFWMMNEVMVSDYDVFVPKYC